MPLATSPLPPHGARHGKPMRGLLIKFWSPTLMQVKLFVLKLKCLPSTVGLIAVSQCHSHTLVEKGVFNVTSNVVLSIARKR